MRGGIKIRMEKYFPLVEVIAFKLPGIRFMKCQVLLVSGKPMLTGLLTGRVIGADVSRSALATQRLLSSV